MPKHVETRRLPYTQEQMYDLVADVGHYAEFLPWVTAVRIRSDSETETLADLLVGFMALREKFTSRVTKRRPEVIHVDYVDGPLAYLHNDWTFRPDDEGGVLIDFSVDFAFRSRMFEAIAGQMFAGALRKMIGAFEERAAKLYAGGTAAASSADGSSSSSAQSAA